MSWWLQQQLYANNTRWYLKHTQPHTHNLNHTSSYDFLLFYSLNMLIPANHSLKKNKLTSSYIQLLSLSSENIWKASVSLSQAKPCWQTRCMNKGRYQTKVTEAILFLQCRLKTPQKPYSFNWLLGAPPPRLFDISINGTAQFRKTQIHVIL